MLTQRTIHRLDVQREYFLKIKNGSKTVEGRAGKVNEAQNICENYKTGESAYKSGDLIQFTISGHDEEGSLMCEITEVRFYASFEEMLQGSGLSACLPGTESLEEGVKLYRGFPGYEERETLFGAAGIHIQVLED